MLTVDHLKKTYGEGRTAVEAIGDLFQEYSRSLFPWMTVRQNVGFPLPEFAHLPAHVYRQIKRRTEAAPAE